MTSGNHTELYEAVYIFDMINQRQKNGPIQLTDKDEIIKTGINESIYKAVIRILVANGLLEYDGGAVALTGGQQEEHGRILGCIEEGKDGRYKQLWNKAVDGTRFFFDRLNELEYEVYSRCNYAVTFETGKKVANHLSLDGMKALELGGNSGGLAASLLSVSRDCHYTVVDTKIPCMVGNEFNETNRLDITFIEGDIFNLELSGGFYDYIIMMNLLHDFDDNKCLRILRNCSKHCKNGTRLVIIEDILASEFKPVDVLTHGLRLAVECRGGGQRTAGELSALLAGIGCVPEESIRLSNVHTMLIMGVA